VIAYPAGTYLNLLQMIRNDLLKSANLGKVSPEFTDVYRNIWELGRKLNKDDSDNFVYYDLYMRCLQLTEPQRYMPLSIQYSKLEDSGYQVLIEKVKIGLKWY